jgi:single-stranded DNA-binding protein
MSEDRKKYDSPSNYENLEARLTKDAEKISDTLVRLTICDESKAESDSPMWIEITPTDRQAHICSFLKKGDSFYVKGKLCLRRYGDNKEKFALNLRRAEVHISYDLKQKLKERGWEYQAPPPRTGGPSPKATARPPANVKRPVVDPVDFGDEE